MPFNHIPVMLTECINGLEIKENGTYVDCTVGGGGHSYEIASHLGPNGRLICIDRDEDALSAASKRLEPFKDKIQFIHGNFVEIDQYLGDIKVDGVLIDLGVSSYQLDTAERGFSYNLDAPLDMRMDRSGGKTAYDIVNSYSKEDLSRIFFLYGEEKFSNKIADKIISSREQKPINTTLELVDLIKSCVPRPKDGGNPAKKVFQAIRIEVNGELEIIEPTINKISSILKPTGRLCVITFHSLEDRVVKQTFASLAKGCTCPPDFPVCVCGKKPVISIINKKPIEATYDECENNPRSHSAKLRIAEKV